MVMKRKRGLGKTGTAYMHKKHLLVIPWIKLPHSPIEDSGLGIPQTAIRSLRRNKFNPAFHDVEIAMIGCGPEPECIFVAGAHAVHVYEFVKEGRAEPVVVGAEDEGLELETFVLRDVSLGLWKNGEGKIRLGVGRFRWCGSYCSRIRRRRGGPWRRSYSRNPI